MNIFTKTLIGSGILLSLILGYSFTFGESKDIIPKRDTQEKVNYDEAEKIAQEFISRNVDNDFWRGKTPKLGEGIPMYMEKDEPSYIEYAVLCDAEKECGFILINLDGDDVKVPMLSHSDISATTILAEKSKTEKNNLEFYYFSPLSVYAKNKITGEIYALDPQVDPTEDLFANTRKEDVTKIIDTNRKNISNLFQETLRSVTEYKQSEDFKTYKKDKDYGTQNTLPDPYSRLFIDGGYEEGCNSTVPCYQQHIYQSGNKQWCLTGCSPVAAAIIIGYHDKYTNSQLIEGSAPFVNYPANPSNVRQLIAELRYHMETTCTSATVNSFGNSIYSGGTNRTYIQNAIHYIWNQEEIASQNAYSTKNMINNPDLSDTMNIISTEVLSNRPLILSISQPNPAFNPEQPVSPTNPKKVGHSIVGFAYNTDSDAGRWVGVNFGWGPYNRASIGMNLNAMILGYDKVEALHTFDIVYE